MQVKTARRIRRQIIRNLSNRLTTLFYDGSHRKRNEIKLVAVRVQRPVCSDSRQWTLRVRLTLVAPKRLFSLAKYGVLCGSFAVYCGRRTATTWLELLGRPLLFQLDWWFRPGPVPRCLSNRAPNTLARAGNYSLMDIRVTDSNGCYLGWPLSTRGL